MKEIDWEKVAEQLLTTVDMTRDMAVKSQHEKNQIAFMASSLVMKALSGALTAGLSDENNNSQSRQ